MNSTIICNKALAHLGEARISDFHERSVLAEKCRTHYELERDALLRMHRWNFARRRAVLSKLSAAPAFGWTCQFQLPSDCLRVLEFNGREIGDASDPAFEIEGRAILTNENEASIVYIIRDTNPDNYDILFCDALAYKLAAALCKEVTNSTTEKGALLQMFQATMKEAGWVDAVESRPRVIPPARNSPTLAARVGAIT